MTLKYLFQMFQRIRDEKPEVLKKLIPVQGDVTFDGLGLSAGPVLDRVLQSTSIVFHLAATLRLVRACQVAERGVQLIDSNLSDRVCVLGGEPERRH